jgi:hypothetical protein
VQVPDLRKRDQRSSAGARMGRGIGSRVLGPPCADSAGQVAVVVNQARQHLEVDDRAVTSWTRSITWHTAAAPASPATRAPGLIWPGSRASSRKVQT